MDVNQGLMELLGADSIESVSLTANKEKLEGDELVNIRLEVKTGGEVYVATDTFPRHALEFLGPRALRSIFRQTFTALVEKKIFPVSNRN